MLLLLLGGVLKVLPEATTWEQSLRVPELEHGLKLGASSDPALVSEALQNHHAELSRVPSCWEECRSFLTSTVDKKKLKTWQGLRQPPSILGHLNKESCSVIFGDVQSLGDSLLVLTDQGGTDSKANKSRRQLWCHSQTFPGPLCPGRAPWGGRQRRRRSPGRDRHQGWLHPHPLVPRVCTTKQLTLRGTVDPEDIAILEPYHAQASEIRRRLEEAGVTGVTVCSATQRRGEAGGSRGLTTPPSPHQGASGATPWRAPSAPAWRAAWTRGTRSWLKSSWAQEALCIFGKSC